MTMQCYDIPRLLMMFESLGEDCRFGQIQRVFGAEPFGIFRFADIPTWDLIELLNTRLASLAAPGDLSMSEVNLPHEFLIESKSCGYRTHTFEFAGVADQGVVLATHARKIRLYKAQFLRDLESGGKMFMLLSNVPTNVVEDTFAAVRRYGPNTLLAMVIVDEDGAPGSVERQSDGLIYGRSRRIENELPLVDWLQTCIRAYRLWKGAAPPISTAQNYLEFAGEPGSPRWSNAAACAQLPANETSFLGHTVFEHRVDDEGKVVISADPMPRPPGKSFVVSMWVKLPEGYRGGRPYPHISGTQLIAEQERRPEPTGQWQYVYRALDLPADVSEISCELHIEAAAGHAIQTSAWCVEAGHRPSGWGVRVGTADHV